MNILRRGREEPSSGGRNRDRRGTATVELAVVAPLLVFLLLGVIDVGQFVNSEQVISNASREGARLAARNTTLNVSEVESSVLGYLANSYPGVSPATLAANVQVNVTDADGDALLDGNLTTIGEGSPVSVEVIAQFDSVRWLDAIGILNNKTLTMTTVMRRE